MKIVTLGVTLTDDQESRLGSLGELSSLPSPESVDDLILKVGDADILYSNGAYLLDSLDHLENCFVTYPYVELGEFNTVRLKEKGVVISNGQGGNRESVIEWVMYMVLSLFREFAPMVRVTENFPVTLKESLVGKNVLIVGHGSFGTQIGVLCEAFGMKVSFFDRGDDLLLSSRDSDLVINALNCNSTSKNLLDENFFMSMKKGSFYLTFVRPHTYDVEGLKKSLDAGIVAGAAIDCDPEGFGDTTNDFYQSVLSNEKILVTPHIAFSTEQAVANGGEVAVKNIECYVRGKPQNILHKV